MAEAQAIRTSPDNVVELLLEWCERPLRTWFQAFVGIFLAMLPLAGIIDTTGDIPLISYERVWLATQAAAALSFIVMLTSLVQNTAEDLGFVGTLLKGGKLYTPRG